MRFARPATQRQDEPTRRWVSRFTRAFIPFSQSFRPYFRSHHPPTIFLSNARISHFHFMPSQQSFDFAPSKISERNFQAPVLALLALPIVLSAVSAGSASLMLLYSSSMSLHNVLSRSLSD